MATLTEALVLDFKEHVVWKEMLERVELQMMKAHNLALDEQDAFECGRYRAFEMMTSLPARLIEEISNEPNK